MRVFVPATSASLDRMRSEGTVPAGTEGYAATADLLAELGVAAAEADDDQVTEAVVTAAADASLLLLAVEEGALARRVVVVVRADAEPATGEHPALVRLTRTAAWSQVDSLLADDRSDEEVVQRARRHVATDVDQALGMTDRLHLGWFSAAEALDG